MICRTGMMSIVTLPAVLALVGFGAVAVGDTGPDLSIGAAEYPADDAVILQWDQEWRIDEDGTVHRRDHKWFKYLHDRPIRDNADPRIDYLHGQDELIIHTAQTHLPDGSILPVPDYSFNAVGPDDVSRFPEYAGWQQKVVSFSGIVDHCVTELDYEVVTPPGVLPWIDADIRMTDDYPIINRHVSVILPDGMKLSWSSDDGQQKIFEGKGSIEVKNAQKQVTKSLKMTSWHLARAPQDHNEPQSLPWQKRSARVRFTTCPDSPSWVSAHLDPVERAAVPGDAIKAYFEKAVKDEVDPAARIEAVATKLRDTFNFVSSPKAMRGLACRDATTVFQDNYGNALEAGALLLAAYQALGYRASAMVDVDAISWDPKDDMPPTAEAFLGIVVSVHTADGDVYVCPRHGVFASPGTAGRHWLLALDGSGSVESRYVAVRGQSAFSTLSITGKVKVCEAGKVSGDMRLDATGLFFDPAKLKSGGAQKSAVSGLIGRVARGVDVADYVMTRLDEQQMQATVQVSSKEALAKVEDHHILLLGDGPAFLAGVPLPLDRSQRRTDVQLAGAFEERVDVTIDLPRDWAVSIKPRPVMVENSKWFSAAQKVTVDGQTIRFTRTISVNKDVLTPDELLEVRRVVNEMRATSALLLAFGAAK